jgi:hypothetical protein
LSSTAFRDSASSRSTSASTCSTTVLGNRAGGVRGGRRSARRPVSIPAAAVRLLSDVPERPADPVIRCVSRPTRGRSNPGGDECPVI